MTKEIRIIGAGMAGLLAANYLADLGHIVSVYEREPFVPNNHKAVLRFRSDVVSKMSGIPFKQVNVIKSVETLGDPVKDALAYSYKCNGVATADRSILTADGSVVKRYVAPEDFIQQMYENAYDKGVSFFFGREADPNWSNGPTVSTIPMPFAHKLWKLNITDAKFDFPSQKGVNITADLSKVDAYVTRYYPSPDYLPYRASITGNKLSIEIAGDEDTSTIHKNQWRIAVEMLRDLIGTEFVNGGNMANVITFEARFSKISPIDRSIAERIMMSLTLNHNVYSLGRFATWRPKVLLDDVVEDITKIERWITTGQYSLLKER